MTTSTTGPEVWFLTGSQGMYGPETLEQVASQSQGIVAGWLRRPSCRSRSCGSPCWSTPASIHRVILEANSAPGCVGVMAWMHTFSPAKMWISGLDALQKPLLHLHTQAGMALPWSTIDMDFMNLNQSAHGDREFGHIQSRLRVARKTVAGHVESPVVVVADRGLGEGGSRARRPAAPAAGPVRRQHAGRGGHRGRQGRGRAAVRRLGQHLRRQRPRRRRGPGRRTATSTRW